jgi:mRNA interferase RelE/StbE
LYRLRVGNYRVVYDIQDDIVRVIVVLIGHRREIYRMLQDL